MFLNTEFLTKPPGILKICETILGVICVGLAGKYYTPFVHQVNIFFLVASVTFFIGTLLRIISCLISAGSQDRMNQTLLEPLYHLVAFILLFSGSVAVLAENDKYVHTEPIKGFLAAGSIGLMNSILYLLSAYDSYLAYTNSWNGSPHFKMNVVPGVIGAVTQTRGPTGVCCCSSCLPSLNWAFLRTREGVVKLLEIILGSICQGMLINYGLAYSLSLGSSYRTFLATSSSSVMTSFVLLVTYIVSVKSFQLIRQSLFEITFNGIISVLYISSSCYLAFAVHTFLYPIYKFTSLFQLYPEMSLTYMVGFSIGLLHGYDAWLAFKKYH